MRPTAARPLGTLIVALLLLCAGCSSNSRNELGCADDDCPPVGPITRPGHRVAVYEIVQEPRYEERRVPVWGEKTVPVYQQRRKPVTITVQDACGCDQVLELWDRREEVQVGVERVRACLGYRTERVQVGTCPRRVLVGWREVADTACP